MGVFALLVAFCLPWGCSRGPAAVLPPAPMAISRVLVLPFVNVAAVYGQGAHAICPVTGKVFFTGPVSDQDVAFLTRALISDLENRTGVEIVLPGQGVGVMSEILNSGGGISERSLWVEAGRALHADAVLVGHVYRFRSRRGTDYAVDAPASVSFDLHLLATADDRLLWSRSVDESQQSLSENLLSLGAFFQRGGRWLKADELAMGCLDRILTALPVGKHLDKLPVKH